MTAQRHVRRFAVTVLVVLLPLLGVVATPAAGATPAAAVPRAAAALKTGMIIGDSISQGYEGDYTWRYRLWQHLNRNNAQLDWVGPWTGTNRMPATPQTGEVHYHDGAYRDGVTFDSAHYSEWGRKMTDAQAAIAGVAPADLDYALVELGFNDLGWWAQDAAGLLTQTGNFIRNLRSKAPNVTILLANVPIRDHLPNNPDLEATIDRYDAALPNLVAQLQSSASPIRLVNLRDNYNNHPPGGDGYDGLHPSPTGEFKIAQQFANALSAVGVGSPMASSEFENPPLLRPNPPSSVQATASPAGIQLTWPHVFGAAAYQLYQEDLTEGGGPKPLPFPVVADSWHVTGLKRGHRYDFEVKSLRGSWSSGGVFSNAVTNNPTTSDGPTSFTVQPSSNSIFISWATPTDPYASTISGYNVYYNDETGNGEVKQVHVADRRTSTTLTGLVSGHRYALAVAAVNPSGEGMLQGAPAAIPGGGTPAVVTGVRATVVDQNNARVSWNAVPGAAGYWIWQSGPTAGAPYERLPLPVTATTVTAGFLAGSSNYSFCIEAVNGTLSSGRSAPVRVTPATGRGDASAPVKDSVRMPRAGSPVPVDPGLLAAIERQAVRRVTTANPAGEFPPGIAQYPSR